MKNLLHITTFFLFALTTQVFGASNLSTLKAPPAAHETASPGNVADMTVGDFLKISPKEASAKSGKKMKWGERLTMKLLQKRLQKQIKKGKISPDDKVSSTAAGRSKYGLLSLIFSGAGILLIWFPYISIIGILAAIAGLILGIVGIGNDENKTMAIIGTVLGAAVVLLFLVAVILIASAFG